MFSSCAEPYALIPMCCSSLSSTWHDEESDWCFTFILNVAMEPTS